jgi:argininosuccinate lyase
MLPQKKNPDVAELARAKSGRLIGHLTGLLVTLKGLPLAYNRDLQEDKEPLFDAVEQVNLALAALGGLLATATFDGDRMAAAADAPETAAAAVDLAEWLVAGGMPFRDAHHVVAGLVREAAEGPAGLAELVTGDLRLGPEAAALLAPGAAVARRTTAGGAGPGPVAEQRERFRRRLELDEARLSAMTGPGGLSKERSPGHSPEGGMDQ